MFRTYRPMPFREIRQDNSRQPPIICLRSPVIGIPVEMTQSECRQYGLSLSLSSVEYSSFFSLGQHAVLTAPMQAAVSMPYRRVTDRHTDGQTARQTPIN